MKISSLLSTIVFIPVFASGCYTTEKDNLADNWEGGISVFRSRLYSDDEDDDGQRSLCV